MPVFNWDADGTPVVRRGFKYYWAITLPLTILVLATWAVATLLPWKEWIVKKPGSPKAFENDIELMRIE
jgi:ABC-type microcin C transport system permease subunit YejB